MKQRKEREFMKCKNCGHTIEFVKHRVPYPFVHYYDKRPRVRCFCGCDKPEPEESD